MDIRADDGNEPVSMSVVYCVRCGSTLHMFRHDPDA
jgi:threonine dehydrogenase-like Zn-dependent dehydrogenase